MKNEFHIVTDKSGTRVWLNGKRMEQVRAVKYEAVTDNVVMVTVELYAKTVNATPPPSDG
jgi:hypothetical protein